MKYIATFINNNNFHNFCVTEFLSVCEIYGIKNVKYNEETFSYDIRKEPYIEISFDDIENPDLCQKLVDRAALLKTIIKVYGEGENMDELILDIQKNHIEEFKNEIDSYESFRFDMDFRGSSEDRKTEIAMIDKFDVFPMNAKVDIKNAGRIFIIFRNVVEDQKINKILSTKYFFGRQIAGKDNKKLRFYTKYDLVHRKYIGPTSTDHILSFLMTNFAQVKKNQLIIDPFVGTGSLLIPPSIYKAICFGCDLDVRVLKGYSVGYTRKEDGDREKRKADIFSNFDVYELERPQIIMQDINKSGFKKNNFFFDCIICDPPYGWRAGVRKTGLSDVKKEKREKRLDLRRKEIKKNKEDDDNKNVINEEENEDWENNKEEKDFNYCNLNGEKRLFLPTSQSTVNNIFDGLIEFANNNLKKDGFLVCLYPVRKEKGEEELANRPIDFPRPPQFKLISVCENVNSRLRSRWCVIYKKIE